jgi:hypothetical protein
MTFLLAYVALYVWTRSVAMCLIVYLHRRESDLSLSEAEFLDFLEQFLFPGWGEYLFFRLRRKGV